MSPLRKFLVVDDDAQARFLISRTLLRHYPDALVQECQDLNTAIEHLRGLAKDGRDTVVVAHQTPQMQGRKLVEALRAAHASVPIVWTGRPEESDVATAAGATRFLDGKAWLLVGKVVEDLV